MTRRRWLLAAVLLGVVVRGPFWIEALRTPVDGDTAIVGLMAEKPFASTTMWGQPYGSPVDAWVAIPFVALFGHTVAALRAPVFLLGLGLIPLAWLLACRVHRDAALPAALVAACPPAYFLLLSSIPPPFYATTLLLAGLCLWLSLVATDALAAERRSGHLFVLWGLVSGLALWTHLMSASAVAVSGLLILIRARRRPLSVLSALAPLLLASAPFWSMALEERAATRVVNVSARDRSTVEHLTTMLPRLYEPLGGVLGTHVPVIADAEDFVIAAPRPAVFGLAVVWGLGFVFAVRRLDRRGPGALLLCAALLAFLAFPLPLRSAPHNIRFLTPLFLPLLAFVVSAPAVAGRARLGLVLALLLATLHLPGGIRLLGAWRATDRSAAPFLLPDLGPVREALRSRGIRHAYASYGPAWRLTWEGDGQVVASQPWNERFRHWPLPLLDEVRFASGVAWVLTPEIPTDLPAPDAFEAALHSQGGRYRRVKAGEATLFLDFVPPWSPAVLPLAGSGAPGDGQIETIAMLDPREPTLYRLDPPRTLAGLTLVAPLGGPTLLRSMDIEVSEDGSAFEVVASRRRRQERGDLRWIGGHPQYVLDHDILPVALGGRLVAALRLTPVASGDPWALAEILLHSATLEPPRPWDDWLDPGLDWPARHRALLSNPKPDREDWYSKLHLAHRNR